MRYKLLILLAFAVLGSCKTKEKVVETSSSTSDSVVTVYEIDTVIETITETDTVFVRVTDPTSGNVTINDPCDSLTGLLRDFEVRAGRTVVSSSGGKLSVTSGCDSIKEVYQKSERERMRLIQELRRLVSKSEKVNIKNTSTERTGFVGWIQQVKNTVFTVIATVVCMLVLYFVLKFTGKI